jgi:hypothetical protein
MKEYEKAQAGVLVAPPFVPWGESLKNRPTLGYWDIRGLAAPIRMLLTHLDVDYNDVRYRTEEEWYQNTKPTLDMNFPNLPYYFDGDVKTSESACILHQICRKYEPTYLGRTLRE